MSTLNVESISHPTSGSNVTINGITPASTGSLGLRNLIINGAMQVAQRGTSETGLTGNANGYPADRFRFFTGSLGTWTIEQSTDAPAGFNKSAKMTCTTGASADAGDYVFLEYSAEAQDLQQLDFGASTAEATTLSFYVKSNKTGTGSVEIEQLDNSNEQFVGTYTINSADTWERKTIAIPADTDGVINDDNGTGLRFRFWLNSGTDYSGGSTTTAWTTYGQTNSNISNLGVGGSDSDNWAITGVQLEVGEVATPFEHRSFNDEYLRCLRYYFRFTRESSAGHLGTMQVYSSSNVAGKFFEWPIPMRAAPTFTQSGTIRIINNTFSTGYAASFANSHLSKFNMYATLSGGSSLSAGNASSIYLNSDGDYIEFNAEL